MMDEDMCTHKPVSLQCCTHVQKRTHTYINDHTDSGQRGCKVLRVRGSDVYRNTSSIETAIEGGYQIDA